jgi:hypothetical protein
MNAHAYEMQCNAIMEAKHLRCYIHDKDEALRASEKAAGSCAMRSWVGRPTLRVNLLLCSGLGVEVLGLC